MYLGVEFLTCHILLHIKAVPNVIGNLFCTPIFKNPRKTGVSIRYAYIVYKLCLSCNRIFSYRKNEKQAFNGLFKVICIQIKLIYKTFFHNNNWFYLNHLISPYFHQFSAVVQIMHFFGAFWEKLAADLMLI